MSKVTLYHGTSTRAITRILRDGILPRDLSGSPGNYADESVRSKSGLVYLTKYYAVTYAANAVNHDDHLAIVEVEAPIDRLYPDEDFIASAVTQNSSLESVKHATKAINPFDHKDLWQLSLEEFGSVAITEVRPAEIKRHVIIPTTGNHLLIGEMGMDINPFMVWKFKPVRAYEWGKLTALTTMLFDRGVEETQLFTAKHRVFNLVYSPLEGNTNLVSHPALYWHYPAPELDGNIPPGYEYNPSDPAIDGMDLPTALAKLKHYFKINDA